MSTEYKFDNPDGVYFVSFATVQWVDVFTRTTCADILIDSLKFCQTKKGLVIHAWCIMSNHVHLIISRNGRFELPEIMRDFKKFTSAQVLKAITDNPMESRKNWMLWIFAEAGKNNPNNTNYQFWQQDSHPEELVTNYFIEQKLNYIHQNPIEAGYVDNGEDYRYSSARDYVGIKGMLEISFLD